MNVIKLEELKQVKDYLIIEKEKINIVFTTAEEERSFNRTTENGINNLENLKKDFKLDEIIYLKQIHSDTIYEYSKGKNIKEQEGDAVITLEKSIAVGAFSADCVPVILTDEVKGVICAVHSGWRGTYASITAKAVKKMQNDFGCKNENIQAYIGAHIRQCCYEISQELKEKFIQKKSNINKNTLFKGRNLSMEQCILDDLKVSGVLDNNIYSLNLCTHCSNKVKFHSYRKSKGDYGRMISFAFLKN